MQNPPNETEVAVAPTRARGVSPAAVLLAVVLAVGVGAFAYWNEEITGYVALHGWDQESPKQVVREFIRSAHAKENASLETTLARNQFTLEKTSNGHVETIRYQTLNGQRSAAPEDLVPPGDPKQIDLEMRRRGDQVFYSAVVQFANDKWGVFRVERRDGGPRITALPEVLDDERPQDLSLY
ncbi:MAG: hypothetical protein ACK47B_02815 [Armatimonadota bacterium]